MGRAFLIEQGSIDEDLRIRTAFSTYFGCAPRDVRNPRIRSGWLPWTETARLWGAHLQEELAHLEQLVEDGLDAQRFGDKQGERVTSTCQD